MAFYYGKQDKSEISEIFLMQIMNLCKYGTLKPSKSQLGITKISLFQA